MKSPITFRLTLVFSFTLIAWIASIYTFQSTLYKEPFDRNKSFNQYYQSQWIIPESKNPISDEILYQVAGYELVTTGIHYKINPEVPPLGKLIYGSSIVFFGNAYIASYLLFILCCIAYFLATKEFIKNPIWQMIAVLLFATDPLLSSLSYHTLLDLPQLLFLLIFIIATIRFLSSKTVGKKLIYASIIGVSFGAFSAVKIALLSIVLLISLLIILVKGRHSLYLLPIIGVAGIVYVSTYFSFFLQGSNLLDLAKAHKWMLTFYAESKAVPVYGSIFPTLILGYNKGWHQGAVWERVREWSLLWPILTIFVVGNIVKYGKDFINNSKYLFLITLSAGLILTYILVPFFTRYLVLVLPLFIILFISYIEKSSSHEA